MIRRMQMGGLKCKMCGSNLDIGDSITVCKCEKCGTSQTVPDIEDDKELKLFERAGRLRFNCDFDKAAGIYNTITDSYTEEAEGYWGLILCKYGIEYADNASGKKVPVCHRISYDSVMDDEDFELVMENSDSESRAIFREEAKIIEENRKKYIQIAESEQPYDIYISYRAKDDNGDKTAVSEIAGHLYNKLTSAGYSVFLSEAALKGKKQSDCEPYIYSALNSANVMLALGTSYDDYNDVWVKNEWNRYLEIAEKNKNKCLIPCYKDVDEYDIPKEFAGLKVCQLGNDDTFNNIMAEIAERVCPPYSDIILRRCFAYSTCLSADVCAMHDPNYPNVMEKNNEARASHGVAIVKYTGSRGKSGASDASAELMAEIRKLFNENGVLWQSSELGKTDLGGGGTISQYVANLNIDTLDCGVPLLSMHSPYEISSKVDVYMAYKGYKAFFNR